MPTRSSNWLPPIVHLINSDDEDDCGVPASIKQLHNAQARHQSKHDTSKRFNDFSPSIPYNNGLAPVTKLQQDKNGDISIAENNVKQFEVNIPEEAPAIQYPPMNPASVQHVATGQSQQFLFINAGPSSPPLQNHVKQEDIGTNDNNDESYSNGSRTLTFHGYEPNKKRRKIIRKKEYSSLLFVNYTRVQEDEKHKKKDESNNK